MCPSHTRANVTELATNLATFVAELSNDDVPDSAHRLAERAILDTIGVTLAGTSTAAADAAFGTCDATGGTTTVLGRDETCPLHDAVFANATAGHALDFDDVALAVMDGHPSVPMVAPMLAIGERENVSGKELLTAYVAGFETQWHVSRPISPDHYESGWHATSTIGVFGAAAAAASLLDLSPERTAHSLNVAASMPAGLKRNFGSTTKPLHAGQAARSGTTAALLAAEGATADPAAIDGRRGFFDLYRGEGDGDDGTRVEPGSKWAILEDGIDVKRYPCCYYTHAAIHAAVDLASAHDIEPDEIDGVRVVASQGAADALHHDDPDTGLEAKFSMPYLIAHAVVHRDVSLAAFDADCLENRTVQTVRERVSLEVDKDRPYDSNAARVEITTRDGDHYERLQKRPPGTHEDPLSIEELHEKFRMCADRAVADVDARAALADLDSLRSVTDVSELLSRF
ncbi:MmgE/PrpD family protein [Natronolimnohabitans sp. A-GB9]|uniref:MmgE/PrpD family protein n=1 Tax=Natronolimnohabitans sp. A-GB9 TaxID=3069757 RepID=UPI0027B5A034|nr:MmgE/PrpD family protein [Natronolimnohabitans sp. A-GB9]MDQ2052535.1 MmgE/PrpD family protein [Natronolimnohabitans sp. A-GB9]